MRSLGYLLMAKVWCSMLCISMLKCLPLHWLCAVLASDQECCGGKVCAGALELRAYVLHRGTGSLTHLALAAITLILWYAAIHTVSGPLQAQWAEDRLHVVYADLLRMHWFSHAQRCDTCPCMTTLAQANRIWL